MRQPSLRDSPYFFSLCRWVNDYMAHWCSMVNVVSEFCQPGHKVEIPIVLYWDCFSPFQTGMHSWIVKEIGKSVTTTRARLICSLPLNTSWRLQYVADKSERSGAFIGTNCSFYQRTNLTYLCYICNSLHSWIFGFTIRE